MQTVGLNDVKGLFKPKSSLFQWKYFSSVREADTKERQLSLFLFKGSRELSLT